MNTENNQEEQKMSHTNSTQSFDIIGETSPKVYEKNFSYEILPSFENNAENNCNNNSDSDSEPQELDETLDLDNEEKTGKNLPVPYNSPVMNSKKSDTYELKILQIKKKIDSLKLSEQNTKTKRELRSLERHLDKIMENKINGIQYDKFKIDMLKFIKEDKNMNQSIKDLYIF
jgi:hypothetical protein